MKTIKNVKTAGHTVRYTYPGLDASDPKNIFEFPVEFAKSQDEAERTFMNKQEFVLSKAKFVQQHMKQRSAAEKLKIIKSPMREVRPIIVKENQPTVTPPLAPTPTVPKQAPEPAPLSTPAPEPTPKPPTPALKPKPQLPIPAPPETKQVTPTPKTPETPVSEEPPTSEKPTGESRYNEMNSRKTTDLFIGKGNNKIPMWTVDVPQGKMGTEKGQKPTIDDYIGIISKEYSLTPEQMAQYYARWKALEVGPKK